MSQEFYSFDEVLRELQVERRELEKMIQEGEVKAIPEGNKIKFAKNDILNFKANKMDMPTLPVKESEVFVFEEIEDAQIADDKGDEDKEEMSEDTETAQPILDISSQPAETSPGVDYEGLKNDEELVFEQESSEDLLETGELLFESKDQALPRDKEIEELFPDSEVGVSPFDSREEKAIEEAWGWSEEAEEDIITASSGNPEQLAIEDSKRRDRIKIIGSIAAGVLAFVVIAIFALMPKRDKVNYAVLSKDRIVKVKQILLSQKIQKEGIVRDITESREITAPKLGIITLKVADGDMVEEGTLLAEVVPDAHAVEETNQQLRQYESLYQQLAAKNKELKVLIDNREKTYREYQKKQIADNRLKYGKIVDEFYSKATKQCQELKLVIPENLEKSKMQLTDLEKQKNNALQNSKKSNQDFQRYIAAYNTYYNAKNSYAQNLFNILVEHEEELMKKNRYGKRRNCQKTSAG